MRILAIVIILVACVAIFFASTLLTPEQRVLFIIPLSMIVIAAVLLLIATTIPLHAIVMKAKQAVEEWFGYFILAVLMVCLSEWKGIPLAAGILIVIITLIADLIADSNPGFMAHVFARKGRTTAIVAFFGLVAAVTLYRFSRGSPGELAISAQIAGQFVLQGVLIGAVLRTLSGHIFRCTLEGLTIGAQRSYFLLGIALAVWLYPFGEFHHSLAPYYIVGIDIGLLLHLAARSGEHSRAQVGRYGLYIYELLSNSQHNRNTQSTLSLIDIDAIRHYARREWVKLDALLEKNRGHWTTPLAIIKASRERFRGNYASALRTIQRELDKPDHDTSLDAHLYVHLALSLGDLGRDEKMFKALDKALAARKKANEDCLLARATRALRRAEMIGKNPNIDASLIRRTLVDIRRAMKMSSISPTTELTAITGDAVPVTWTFLFDAYGYVLLKIGMPRYARSLFTYCIYEDPRFSSPYVHLGELYLMRARKLTEWDKQNEARRLARFCLTVGFLLEGERKSRIRRTAKELLKETKK